MIRKLWEWLFGPCIEVHFFCGHRRREDGRKERYIRSAMMLVDGIEGPNVYYGETGPIASDYERDGIAEMLYLDYYTLIEGGKR